MGVRQSAVKLVTKRHGGVDQLERGPWQSRRRTIVQGVSPHTLRILNPRRSPSDLKWARDDPAAGTRAGPRP